jgi:Dolichyl-phosphate-mannose--protein O-mannosyl transferase
MTNETTALRTWQKKAKRRLFFTEELAKFTLRDWLVMLAVTLCYAVLAFTNLGVHEIADTGYTMETGDDIRVTFDRPEDIAYIKYFTSLGTGELSFSYSLDGRDFTQYEKEVEEKDDEGQPYKTMSTKIIGHVATDMYEWQFIEVSFTAQYVIIHVDKGGLRMTEMAFCDSEGSPVGIAFAEYMDSGAERGNEVLSMFDEQEYVPLQTYYMTEMYFDEVYHARTGYEYINHLSIYEVTHPPLGKNMLSIGIYLFGMNPFGWRCMGALFGVLMLPLMYVFAKRLFKKTLFAFIPTFLMAVDFMHYTQTRIATIDSYSVFFIILMYLFMYLYSETNYNRQPLVNTLFPLSLAGVAFGLGAATKWLCIYAGAGLAILLFVQLGKRYMEYAYARQTLGDEQGGMTLSADRRAYLEDISRGYVRRTLITLLWCVLFFIIVPLALYIMAYTPYLAPATDSAGVALRIAYLVFTGLLILGLFAMWMLKIRNDHRAAVAAAETANAEAGAVSAGEDAEAAPQKRAGSRNKPEVKYAGKRLLAIMLCVFALAIAGTFLCYTSFTLYTDTDKGAYDFQDILKNQEYMFNYHSDLKPDHVHPFSSKWYLWPLDIRPVFFFQGRGYTGDTLSSMSTMGNPLVWWGGLAAVIALVVIRIRKGRFGKRTFFISVAALSQYLPYTLITREMFIYHYFATVPFLILLMAVLAKYLVERTKHGRRFVFIFLGACLLLFILFYPVTTGIVMPRWYVNVIRWLPSWPFY